MVLNMSPFIPVKVNSAICKQNAMASSDTAASAGFTRGSLAASLILCKLDVDRFVCPLEFITLRLNV